MTEINHEYIDFKSTLKKWESVPMSNETVLDQLVCEAQELGMGYGTSHE